MLLRGGLAVAETLPVVQFARLAVDSEFRGSEMSGEVLELKTGWTIGPLVRGSGSFASEGEGGYAAGAVGRNSRVRKWCDWCELKSPGTGPNQRLVVPPDVIWRG